MACKWLFSTKKITVLTVYTCEFILGNQAHIPTPETAKAWPHLEHLADNIALEKKCKIGLLIGYNFPQALLPREVVCGENQPFAQKTRSRLEHCELWQPISAL